MTCYDSRLASVARLSLILSMRAGFWTSSIDRTHPSGGGDAGHVPAPLPVLPVTPSGLSPIGKEGSGIPPMSFEVGELSGPRARDACLGEEVLLDSLSSDVTGITFH
jgi:hypothetical protein